MNKIVKEYFNCIQHFMIVANGKVVSEPQYNPRKRHTYRNFKLFPL